MFKAKVVKVEKVAHNEENVTLVGEDFRMIITLTNPEDHGSYSVDEEVSISVDQD